MKDDMTEFEFEVTQKLARLEERTVHLPKLAQDVADIKGKVGLLEFKASLFGTIAGTIVVLANRVWGR